MGMHAKRWAGRTNFHRAIPRGRDESVLGNVRPVDRIFHGRALAMHESGCPRSTCDTLDLEESLNGAMTYIDHYGPELDRSIPGWRYELIVVNLGPDCVVQSIVRLVVEPLKPRFSLPIRTGHSQFLNARLWQFTRSWSEPNCMWSPVADESVVCGGCERELVVVERRPSQAIMRESWRLESRRRRSVHCAGRPRKKEAA